MPGRLALKPEAIQSHIREIRGRRIILDFELARIYGVSTMVFNQAVRRNMKRFPADFVFQLTAVEYKDLISQIVISSSWGGRRKKPLAFTEHGAVMAANVLRSPRAIRMSVEVVRAFIQLRQLAISHNDLAKRLDALEEKYDGQFQVAFDAIRQLMDPPEDEISPKKPIGFQTEQEG
jgi:hypothetical protein